MQQQQNNFIEIMAIQARNIKDLKQLVQQLAKKLQENNERILQNENNHKLLNSSTPNKNGKSNLISENRAIFALY